MAQLGASHGPRWWLRVSPGPIGALIRRVAATPRRQVHALIEWTEGVASVAAERELFANYAHCLAESLAGPSRHTPNIEVTGREHLLTASEAGHGVVLLTAHCGAWEAAGAALSADSARPLTFVMEPEGSEGARAVHEQMRRDSGIHTAYGHNQAASGLALVEALGREELVGFQLDRVRPGAKALAVQLFGRRFLVPQGPFRVARVAGAPLVPVFSARTGFLRYRVRIYPPLTLPPRADLVALGSAAQYGAECLSDFLRDHPRQWFHFADVPPAEEAAGR